MKINVYSLGANLSKWENYGLFGYFGNIFNHKTSKLNFDSLNI